MTAGAGGQSCAIRGDGPHQHLAAAERLPKVEITEPFA